VIHVQNIIDAIGLGAVFALIAVGIGLVFGVLRLINFAYGQLIMLAAYALAFTDSWPDAASVLAAVLVAVVASLLMERIAFRPLRTADPSTMLVATFALAYLLENAALVQYTYRQQGIIGDPIGTLAQLNQAATIGSLHVRWASILAIGAGVVSLGALALLLNRTSIGLQMRAASMDFRTARLLGVRADTVITAAVAVAGVLAAVAAVVLSIGNASVTPTTGLYETLFVLVGVVAGSAFRRRRKTTRSIRIVSPITTTKHMTIERNGLQPFVRARVYAPAMISWPYAKLMIRSTPNTRPMPTAISA